MERLSEGGMVTGLLETVTPVTGRKRTGTVDGSTIPDMHVTWRGKFVHWKSLVRRVRIEESDEAHYVMVRSGIQVWIDRYRCGGGGVRRRGGKNS